MNTYCINQVRYGMPEKTVLEVQAHNLTAAWLGSKSWFIHGTFYVFPKGNYGAGVQFSK